MVTGDNILTAICVSRSCGIVKPDERIFLPTCDDQISSFIDYDSNTIIQFQDLIVQPDSVVSHVVEPSLSYWYHLFLKKLLKPS